MASSAPQPGVNSREGRPVLVTGASGFIGRHLVRSLVRRGERVIALIRPGAVNPFASEALVEEIRGEITDPRAAIEAARRAAWIVHLAGMTSVRGADFARAFRTNVVGTMNVLDAARLRGVERLIVLGTQSENTGSYAVTKRQADDLVKRSDAPHVVLRPALVYGPGAGGVFAAVARLVRRLPVIPLIGGGGYAMRPVFVDDVCDAIREALRRPSVESEYYLSGPRAVTFRELVEGISRHQGLRRRLIAIPYPLAAAGIGFAEALRLPLPVSSDTLRGLIHPRLHDSASAERDLGFRPIDIEEGLRRTFP